MMNDENGGRRAEGVRTGAWWALVEGRQPNRGAAGACASGSSGSLHSKQLFEGGRKQKEGAGGDGSPADRRRRQDGGARRGGDRPSIGQLVTEATEITAEFTEEQHQERGT